MRKSRSTKSLTEVSEMKVEWLPQQRVAVGLENGEAVEPSPLYIDGSKTISSSTNLKLNYRSKISEKALF